MWAKLSARQRCCLTISPRKISLAPAFSGCGVWRRWTVIAHIIGTFQARVLLSVFYLVVIPPFALIVKLWLDPLHLRRAAGSSAWITRPPQPEADVLRAGRQY